MLTVRDFLDQLPEAEHLAIADAIGAGLFNARHAAQCLTDPGPQTENVVQLLAYIATALEALESAREIVRRRA